MREDRQIRLSWISRSVRLPSPRRLAGFVRQTRSFYRQNQVTGLIIVQGRYRLHVIEGAPDKVAYVFQESERQRIGTGVRLIGETAIREPACFHTLACLDITALTPSSRWPNLEEIYGRASFPDHATRQRVEAFLQACLSLDEMKHAA